MTMNTLADLNDHLFAQLERLDDEELKGEALDDEIKRSKAVSSIAGNIIQNANTVLNAIRFKDEALDANAQIPKMLGGEQ